MIQPDAERRKSGEAERPSESAHLDQAALTPPADHLIFDHRDSTMPLVQSLLERGDLDSAAQFLVRNWECSHDEGRDAFLLEAVSRACGLVGSSGVPQRAVEFLSHVAAMIRAVEPDLPSGLDGCLEHLSGRACAAAGDVIGVERHLGRALKSFRALGQPGREAAARVASELTKIWESAGAAAASIGIDHFAKGEMEPAAVSFAEALRWYSRLGDGGKDLQAQARYHCALVAFRVGDVSRAEEIFIESLRRDSEGPSAPLSRAGLALVAAAHGNWKAVENLIGTALSQRATLPPAPECDRPLCELIDEVSQAALSAGLHSTAEWLILQGARLSTDMNSPYLRRLFTARMATLNLEGGDAGAGLRGLRDALGLPSHPDRSDRALRAELEIYLGQTYLFECLRIVELLRSSPAESDQEAWRGDGDSLLEESGVKFSRDALLTGDLAEDLGRLGGRGMARIRELSRDARTHLLKALGEAEELHGPDSEECETALRHLALSCQLLGEPKRARRFMRRADAAAEARRRAQTAEGA